MPPSPKGHLARSRAFWVVTASEDGESSIGIEEEEARDAAKQPAMHWTWGTQLLSQTTDPSTISSPALSQVLSGS